MLREYEFTFVTRIDSADKEKDKILDGYEEILQRENGAILKKDEWGTKRLSYPIRKNFKGHYTHYVLASNPTNIAECERLLKIDDNVLRHLVIKVKDRVVDVEKRKAELAGADAAAPQQES